MKISPVIHIQDGGVQAAVREGERAFELGSDEVFLVDRFHGGVNKKPLFDAYDRLASEFPDRHVGVNIFGLGSYGAMLALARSVMGTKELSSMPASIWVDDIHNDESEKSDTIRLRESEPKLKQVRLLGGISLDQTDAASDNLKMVINKAERLKDSVDVVVAHLAALGMGSVIEKLRIIKDTAGGKSLAVSGIISPESILDLSGVVNEVLVFGGTEARRSLTFIDEHNLEELIKAAHKLAM